MGSVRTQLWRVRVAWICAILLLAVWAAAPVHGHSDSAKDVCTVCQFEHSPAASAVVSPPVPPPASCYTAITPAAVSHLQALEPSKRRGRAPPASA